MTYNDTPECYPLQKKGERLEESIIQLALPIVEAKKPYNFA